MNKLSKVLLSAGLCTIISCTNSPEIPYHPPQVIRKKEKPETKPIPVQQLVHKLMKYQEMFTGVSYNNKIPQIKFDQNLDFNDVAVYKAKEETIFLHPRYNKVNLDNILNNLTSENLNPEESELREVVAHELGHFLTHQYIKQHVPNSWLAKYFNKEEKRGIQDTDAYIVIEGIGEYFGNLIHPRITVFATERWNAKFNKEEFESNNFRTWLAYMGGRDLTTPILKDNAHKGLIYLLENELVVHPPNLSTVPMYKQKALEDLSQ